MCKFSQLNFQFQNLPWFLHINKGRDLQLLSKKSTGNAFVKQKSDTSLFVRNCSIDYYLFVFSRRRTPKGASFPVWFF